MTSHALDFTAAPGDIDELGHVNNAVWVRWAQELATAHWHALAPTEAVARYIWVVNRHEIDFRGNIASGERAKGRTWVAEPPQGARFWREFRFTDDAGATLVEGRTRWALIDADRRRPARVPADLARLFLG